VQTNKKIGYISPICPEVSRGRICANFGIGVVVAGIITCDNFFAIG